MALMTCPNCGRENVSSTAQWCPACEYHINNYVHKQELIEQTQEKIDKLKKENPEERKKNSKMYFGDNVMKVIKIFIISVLAMGIFGFFTFFVFYNKMYKDDFLLSLLEIAAFIISVFAFAFSVLELIRIVKEAKNKEDFYKDETLSSYNNKIKQIENNNLPYHAASRGECPHCGYDFLSMDYTVYKKYDFNCPECNTKIKQNINWKHNGVICPHCGSKDFKVLEKKQSLLSEKISIRYHCHVCNKIFEKKF